MDDEELVVMKYFLAGLVGFLVHITWLIFGGIFLNTNYLNIMKFYSDAFERNNDIVPFIYALGITIIFSLIARIFLIKVGQYNSREKRILSLSGGIGFYLAFVLLMVFFRLMFAGFSF